MEQVMSDCRRFKNILEAYVSGEAAHQDVLALRAHAESCTECRRAMELHGKLSQMADGMPQPSEDAFRAMRAAVLRRIPRPGREAIEGSGVAAGFWRRLWARPVLGPAFAFVLALAILGAGFALGRRTAPAGGFSESVIVKEIARQASLGKGLAGYWDSPFVYSNVKFHPSDGDVSLSFDVTRHVDLMTAGDSPVLREILLHAILDPSAIGTRLEAIELAPKNMDAKVKEVLVFTLLNDPSLPVRLRALEVLTPYADDPVVKDALLSSLGQDPSVQVRFMALDCLAGRKVDPETIRSAIGEVRRDTDRAVYERAVQLTGGL
jgi:hypothetical protein